MKILALLGARVLHPQTIYPTVKKSIPINVKSIYHPDEDGTWILPTTKKRGDVVGITAKKVVSVEQIEFFPYTPVKHNHACFLPCGF